MTEKDFEKIENKDQEWLTDERFIKQKIPNKQINLN
jgi:hypothetical protein